MMMITDDMTTTEPVVRPATQAGRFYEAHPQRLAEEVDSFLNLPLGTAVDERVAALIVPHAGYYFSGRVAAAAYTTLPTPSRYERIFLLGPSHHEWIDGASVNSEVDYYSTPLGRVKVDRETAYRLRQTDSVFTYRETTHEAEHCLEVQLPFLQRRWGEVPPIVPVIVATNDFTKLRRIAEVLKPYFNERNLFIISSDFSHYPSYEDACEVDALTGKAIESGDVQTFIATVEANARKGMHNLATSACGAFPIVTLMCMMDRGYEVRHLMYQNSGDADNHDHSRVVGYHAFAIVRKDQNKETFTLTDEDKRQLKAIALQSIRDSLDGKPIAQKSSMSNVLNQKCGAFVSLHQHGRLRGCIGHFGEDVPLHEIVAEMTRAAAFEDPRFTPLRREELDDTDIEISVLTPMRRIQSLDEFELHRHGIYIRKGYRSGTFLPQVADEVNWTKEEFVGHCSRDKAGLGWDGWREAELYVYEAIVF